MKDLDKKQKGRNQELDDFWDISSLVPKKSLIDTDTANITSVAVENSLNRTKELIATSSNVIKRYVDPLHYENKKIRKESYESEEVYYPENSLLHRVKIRKRKSEYNLYSEFYEDALRYKNARARECEYAAYYSYVPQYNQLNDEQLNYYLWWKYCFLRDELIKTDYSYVLLYIFELINLGNADNAVEHQNILCKLWNAYHEKFPALAGKLGVWICDFCLLHRLSTPSNISKKVFKTVPSLKEFYLNMPQGDYSSCTESLLKYGTEYDYRLSKFAKGENLPLFDKHIFGAVLTAVKFYSKDGPMLSGLSSEDSKIIRNVFEGALCTSAQRYEIEVKYCSFSRSNELRYLMADIVKYSENKIRAYLGIKSKLTVYSVGVDLQRELDKYFEAELFSIPKVPRKKEERHEYDALYDLPKVEFSLEKAKRIENDSWSVTNDLVSAFEEEFFDENKVNITVEPISHEIAQVTTENTDSIDESPLRKKLSQYISFIEAVSMGDYEECKRIATSIGKMTDALIDAINEICAEEIGDILIEEIDGRLEIIECYKELL